MKEGEGEGNVPDEIVVLPVRTETGDLEEEEPIVVEQAVDFVQERVVPAHTDVLREGTRKVSIIAEK